MTKKQVLIIGAAAIVVLACMSGIAWKYKSRGSEPGGGSVHGTYRQTEFSVLAFPYNTPPRRPPGSDAPPRPDPFPAQVRALNGEGISIVGYMAPLTMNAGRIDSFYLSRGVFNCCYADAPKITDYIRVTMAPGQFAPNADVVQVNGVLEVGEERNSIGFVETVYRMKADSVLTEDGAGSGWAEVVAWGVGGLFALVLAGPASLRMIHRLRERYRVVPAIRNESIS